MCAFPRSGIALAVLLILAGGCRGTADSDYPELDFRHWTGERFVYSPNPGDAPLFKFTSVAPALIGKCAVVTANENKTYRFGEITLPDNTVVLIIVTDETAVQVGTEEGSWRPIEGQWLNAKLLLITRYFNPHYGCYCIYDVERKKVILEELENDGMDAWRSYQEEPRRKW